MHLRGRAFDPEAFSLTEGQQRLRSVEDPRRALKERRTELKQGGRGAKIACSCGLCNRQTAPPNQSSTAMDPLERAIPGIHRSHSMGGEFSPEIRRRSHAYRGEQYFSGRNALGLLCCRNCVDVECPNNPEVRATHMPFCTDYLWFIIHLFV